MLQVQVLYLFKVYEYTGGLFANLIKIANINNIKSKVTLIVEKSSLYRKGKREWSNVERGCVFSVGSV